MQKVEHHPTLYIGIHAQHQTGSPRIQDDGWYLVSDDGGFQWCGLDCPTDADVKRYRDSLTVTI